MLVYRSAVAAATSACALLAGCSDPAEPTDLRSQSSGPPNVTTVMVMSDLVSSVDPNVPGLARLIETATHCRTGDDKRPGLVGLPNFTTTQVCPDDLSQPSSSESVAEGAPPVWYARVVFDKLLDPDIEDLVVQPNGDTTGTIAKTLPVVLRCGVTKVVDVPYDGYYVPNGNRISWPLGPALYIAPLSATSVPTGAQCELQLRDIVQNKLGQSVPDDQRTFNFKIADMAFRFSVPDPTDSPDGSHFQDIDTPVKFYWTAALAVGANGVIDPTAIKITKGPNLNASATSDGDADPAVCNGTGGTAVPASDIETAPDGTDAESTALIMDLDTKGGGAAHLWDPQTTYRIQFTADAKASPSQGGAAGAMPSDYDLCFHTAAAAPM